MSGRYVSFDFHHVCGNSNFENLKVLYEQISEQFEKQGYFLVDAKGSIPEEQKGIVRSNCIDCLDSTNGTQSYLAQKCLDEQLQSTGVLDSSESICVFAEDYQTSRALWVEQGDEISLEYAGTYALNGDLVRYGEQTFGGIIKDGMSALSRYFLNNLQEGIRQDAMDLISGRYIVRRDISSSRAESFSNLNILAYDGLGSTLMVQLHILKVNLVRNHAYFSKYERYLMDMLLVTKGEVKFNSSKLDV